VLQQLIDRCASLSYSKVVFWGLLLAIVLELFTAWLRFGFGLASSQATAMLGKCTCGLRIHHGYLGLPILLAVWCLPASQSGWRKLGVLIAIGLIVSDLVHHFLVLWPITGSPQFDLTYPRSPERKDS
jgi:hypothetical protein